MIASQFRRDLLHHKTRVSGLSCNVVIMILRLRNTHFGTTPTCDGQTDGQTYRHMTTANTTLGKRHAGKNEIRNGVHGVTVSLTRAGALESPVATTVGW